MTFKDFINSIVSAFNTVFPHIASYIDSLINNNFIKLIIYLGLFTFIINLLFGIIKIIFMIFKSNKDRETVAWVETHDLDTGIKKYTQSVHNKKANYTTERTFRSK